MAQARLGGRVRRLRQDLKLTQTQMAEQLGLSPSYLNLIEHNQRAVTAPVLLKLVQRFNADIASFTAEDDERTTNDLMEVFADPLFDGHGLKPADLTALVADAPNLAKAVLTLYQAWRGGPASSRAPASPDADGQAMGEDDQAMPAGMPSEEVTDFIQERGNYFKDLEVAAEGLRRDLDCDQDGLAQALTRHLAHGFAVDVEVRPAAGMNGLTRSYDPRARRLAVSELLTRPSRTFALAYQVAMLEHRGLIDRLAAGGKFTTTEADTLARVALANYFAGAALMPYAPFLDAAREARYEIEPLERRFGASFEQVCHRLTTLRRPGAQGVPFHMLRVDVAGNISKRFSASGIRIARFGGACPRWNVYDAFSTPGMIRRQISRMPDGATFFCIAATLPMTGRQMLRGHLQRASARQAVGLGCPASFAREIVYADGLPTDDAASIIPIGVSCRTCPRADCVDRAAPSLRQRLTVDENRRGLSAFVDLPDPR